MMNLLHNVNHCLIVTLIAPTAISLLWAPQVTEEVREWEENDKESSFYASWKEKIIMLHGIKVASWIKKKALKGEPTIWDTAQQRKKPPVMHLSSSIHTQTFQKPLPGKWHT
jgi:hypothetical protein